MPNDFTCLIQPDSLPSCLSRRTESRKQNNFLVTHWKELGNMTTHSFFQLLTSLFYFITSCIFHFCGRTVIQRLRFRGQPCCHVEKTNLTFYHARLQIRMHMQNKPCFTQERILGNLDIIQRERNILNSIAAWRPASLTWWDMIPSRGIPRSEVREGSHMG